LVPKVDEVTNLVKWSCSSGVLRVYISTGFNQDFDCRGDLSKLPHMRRLMEWIDHENTKMKMKRKKPYWRSINKGSDFFLFVSRLGGRLVSYREEDTIKTSTKKKRI